MLFNVSKAYFLEKESELKLFCNNKEKRNLE